MLQFPWELDSRSLALCRVLLALTVLSDLLVRVLFGLQEHLTDVGSYPRDLSLQIGDSGRLEFPSIYFISGNLFTCALLISLHAGVTFCVMIGYRSRWSTFLTWYMTTSLAHRNEALMCSGDQLLSHVLFWSLFVPMGSVYSVDAVLTRSRSIRRKGQPFAVQEYKICNAGTFAMLVQVTLLYVVAAIFKQRSAIWQSGSALYHILSFRYSSLPPALWLRGHPQLTYMAARIVVQMQLYIPALLWVPVRHIRGTCTFAAVILLGFVHAGIALTLNLHFFVFVDFAFLAAFLPDSFWNLVSAVTTPLRRRQRCLAVEWPSAFNGYGTRLSPLDLFVHILQELCCLQSIVLCPLHPQQFAATDTNGKCISGRCIWLRVKQTWTDLRHDIQKVETQSSCTDSKATVRHRTTMSKSTDRRRELKTPTGGVGRNDELKGAIMTAQNWAGVFELLRASPVAWLLAAPLLLLLPSALPSQPSCVQAHTMSDVTSETRCGADTIGIGGTENVSGNASAATAEAWEDPADKLLRQLKDASRLCCANAQGVVVLGLVFLVAGLNVRQVSESEWQRGREGKRERLQTPLSSEKASTRVIPQPPQNARPSRARAHMYTGPRPHLPVQIRAKIVSIRKSKNLILLTSYTFASHELSLSGPGLRDVRNRVGRSAGGYCADGMGVEGNCSAAGAFGCYTL
jgi:hypothetical protein